MNSSICFLKTCSPSFSLFCRMFTLPDEQTPLAIIAWIPRQIAPMIASRYCCSACLLPGPWFNYASHLTGYSPKQSKTQIDTRFSRQINQSINQSVAVACGSLALPLHPSFSMGGCAPSKMPNGEQQPPPPTVRKSSKFGFSSPGNSSGGKVSASLNASQHQVKKLADDDTYEVVQGGRSTFVPAILETPNNTPTPYRNNGNDVGLLEMMRDAGSQTLNTPPDISQVSRPMLQFGAGTPRFSPRWARNFFQDSLVASEIFCFYPWLIAWLINSFVDWSCSVDRWIDWSIVYLFAWLIGCLIDWLIDWLKVHSCFGLWSSNFSPQICRAPGNNGNGFWAGHSYSDGGE